MFSVFDVQEMSFRDIYESFAAKTKFRITSGLDGPNGEKHELRFLDPHGYLCIVTGDDIGKMLVEGWVRVEMLQPGKAEG